MRKDKEWLKKEVRNAFSWGVSLEEGGMIRAVDMDYVIKLIDQLEEPEVLSQEWIDGHAEHHEYIGYAGVPVDDLQNVLVPKQEEVDRAYKDGYETGKQYTFYKGYLEGLVDKEKEYANKADMVSQPNHYIGEYGLEVEDVLRNFIPRYTDPYVGHRIASAIEYLLRSPLKNGQQDIEKARNNLNQALVYMEDTE